MNIPKTHTQMGTRHKALDEDKNNIRKEKHNPDLNRQREVFDIHDIAFGFNHHFIPNKY